MGNGLNAGLPFDNDTLEFKLVAGTENYWPNGMSPKKPPLPKFIQRKSIDLFSIVATLYETYTGNRFKDIDDILDKNDYADYYKQEFTALFNSKLIDQDTLDFMCHLIALSFDQDSF